MHLNKYKRLFRSGLTIPVSVHLLRDVLNYSGLLIP